MQTKAIPEVLSTVAGNAGFHAAFNAAFVLHRNVYFNAFQPNALWESSRIFPFVS